jgi:hypothetical protein
MFKEVQKCKKIYFVSNSRIVVIKAMGLAINLCHFHHFNYFCHMMVCIQLVEFNGETNYVHHKLIFHGPTQLELQLQG